MLERMAGGTATFFPASSQQDLADAFATIGRAVTTCTFKLSQTRYLGQLAGKPIVPEVAAFLAGLDAIEKKSPDIARAIANELADQRTHLKLIASENYCSLATQLAQGNLLTDKYAEGFAGHRFYAGCDNIDTIESARRKRCCASAASLSIATRCPMT